MPDTMPHEPAPTKSGPSFLVIRRDNIGDLVCTTPLITALRTRFPTSWIGALVNRYTAPVLENNPDVSEVISYEKAKHRSGRSSLLGIYWDRLRMVRALRRRGIDYVLLAAPVRQESAETMARLIRPRHVVGFGGRSRLVDLPVAAPEGLLHQAERTYSLLRALGIEGAPPPLRLNASPALERRMRELLPPGRAPVVGIHISAREDDRRWPDRHFADFIRRLLAQKAAVVLTWAPGERSNPRFPGDDRQASRLVGSIPGDGLVAMRTESLSELIAALAVCDFVVSSDGGPVHLAAGLRKPVLCFFGHEEPRLWHPWGVPYQLLRTPSFQVKDITVDAAWAAWERLRNGMPGNAPAA